MIYRNNFDSYEDYIELVHELEDSWADTVQNLSDVYKRLQNEERLSANGHYADEHYYDDMEEEEEE